MVLKKLLLERRGYEDEEALGYSVDKELDNISKGINYIPKRMEDETSHRDIDVEKVVKIAEKILDNAVHYKYTKNMNKATLKKQLGIIKQYDEGNYNKYYKKYLKALQQKADKED